MTNSQPWRFASASAIGTTHERFGEACQDRHACQVWVNGTRTLAVAVADGAGSASQPETGAEIACAVFLEQVRVFLQNSRSIKDVTRSDTCGWLTAVQEAISDHARRCGLHAQEYACTLVFAAVDTHSAVFIQLGDGGIVIPEERGGWELVFWPQRGEFVDSTFFVTDRSAVDKLKFDRIDRRLDDIAVFSDGVEPIALVDASKSVFAPFFDDVFSFVRKSRMIGQDLELSTQLAHYLSSPKIAQRTNDDKTLVLATRRNGKG